LLALCVRPAQRANSQNCALPQYLIHITPSAPTPSSYVTYSGPFLYYNQTHGNPFQIHFLLDLPFATCLAHHSPSEFHPPAPSVSYIFRLLLSLPITLIRLAFPLNVRTALAPCAIFTPEVSSVSMFLHRQLQVSTRVFIPPQSDLDSILLLTSNSSLVMFSDATCPLVFPRLQCPAALAHLFILSLSPSESLHAGTYSALLIHTSFGSNLNTISPQSNFRPPTPPIKSTPYQIGLTSRFPTGQANKTE